MGLYQRHALLPPLKTFRPRSISSKLGWFSPSSTLRRRHSMNKLLISGAIPAFALAMAPAVAQVAPPPGVASGTAPPPLVMPGAPRAAPQIRMQIMSDRLMTRDEVLKHVSQMFAKLDTNKDGYITKPEVDALRQRMEGAMGTAGDIQRRMADRGIMMGDRNQIFDRLDTN